MASQEITDRNGEPINIGDTVAAKARGGKHAGEVKEIVTDKQEAEEKGLNNPPKIVLQDQHGHMKSQNPGTVVHGDEPNYETPQRGGS